jgi:hypothetical protein
MTEKIPPPQSFTRVCRQFHVDIEVMCPTFEEMAKFALDGVEGEERQQLAEFLDHLLTGAYTPEELEELWNSSGADVFIPDVKNLTALFTAMRRELDTARP